METFWQDIRFGMRLLLKSRGFTFVAILTLALGIGSSATMFSVLEAAAFVRPHVKDLDRIANLWATNLSAGWERSSVSVPAYLDWRSRNHSFEDLAAFAGGSYTLTGISEPVRVSVEQVSTNFFRVLGVEPALGRTFIPNEDRPGAEPVVVLSHDLWQRSFSSRPDVLGETVRLNDRVTTVIGVMPPGFGFPDAGTNLWTPLILDPARSSRTYRQLAVFGRLKSGVSAKQAQEEMNSLARQSEDEHPDTERGWGVRVIRVRDEMTKRLALGLAGLLGPSLCVLLIVCANLANLLLARAAARQREVAVRVALGAGRLRLIRQLLTEGFLLSLAGSALGFLLSYWGIHLVRLLLPASAPRHLVESLQIDFHVLAFALALSFLAPLVFGLAPALSASKPDLVETLKEGGRRPAFGLGRHSLRDLLVASQITLAMVLLIALGVWVKAMIRLQRVDPGFDPRNVLALELSPPSTSYATNDQLGVFYGRILEQVAALPGAQAAGITSRLPGSWGERSSLSPIALEGSSTAELRGQSSAVQQAVSPDYFATMGIPLLAGRAFTVQDSGGAPRVAVISRAMAVRFWHNDDPLGKRFKLGATAANNPWMTVVGVAGDVIRDDRLEASLPQVYLPYAQNPVREMSLVLRTNGSPGNWAAAVRNAVRSVDKNLPLDEIYTMERVLAQDLEGVGFLIGLVAVFATLALLLAAVGVYGVASFLANARSREIGIRMALGAQPRNVLWLVIRQGLVFILAGVGLGVAGAVGASLVLWSEVAGISPADPLALSLSALVLGAVAMLGNYIPARRATKVQPSIALRCD